MSALQSTLLVVEDDATTRAFLNDNLTADGYSPRSVDTLAEAQRVLEEGLAPDLVLCDLVLPDGSGLDLVRQVRTADGIVSRIDPATPIVMLSGRASEIDRVRGLQRGCDDYVAKPFHYAELRLRIDGLLRRVDRRPTAGTIRVGSLELDPARRTVLVRDTPVALTQKEYSLLLAFVREPTRVVTKDQLLRSIWGFRARGATRTIDSHACRLRRKLGVHGDEFVVNVWGVGYRLVEAAPDVANPRDVATLLDHAAAIEAAARFADEADDDDAEAAGDDDEAASRPATPDDRDVA